MEHVVKIRVTGLGPLLMNNPAGMLEPADKGPTKKRKYTAEGDAAKSAYMAKNGKHNQLYMPAAAFRAALITGGKSMRIGKLGAPGLLMAAVFPVGDKVWLDDPKTGKPLKTYTIHTCRAVVVKAAIPRSRAEIPKWTATLTVTVDDDFISVDDVLVCLNKAGRIAGVGDFRVEKKGVHGRFEAKLLSSKAA